MTPTDRAPSAVTHDCAGGCGTQLTGGLFACRPCFRRLPHNLRQGITQTSKLRYLHSSRLAARHAAEDWYEADAKRAAQPKPQGIVVPPHTFGPGPALPPPNAGAVFGAAMDQLVGKADTKGAAQAQPAKLPARGGQR